MIKKLFSDKFWEKFGNIVQDNAGDIIGLNKAKIIFYPFTGKSFQDIKQVFVQAPEEDAELLSYYQPYWNKGKSRWQSIALVVQAVNNRIKKYTNDIDNIAYKSAEYWGSPITVHRLQEDDCDGKAVLSCYVLRLLGCLREEVFVAKGYAVRNDGSKEMHAYLIVIDFSQEGFGNVYPLEGTFYASDSMSKFLSKSMTLHDNPHYEKPEWITNDNVSYANTRWFKFIK